MKPAVLGLMLLGLVCCSAPERTEYQMTWRLEEDGTCPTMRHVILQFVDFPAYSYGICSDELARYLGSYGSRPLTVAFEIYAPDAELGGGEPTRIGDLTEWEDEFAHMGSYQEHLSAGKSMHPWRAVNVGD